MKKFNIQALFAAGVIALTAAGCVNGDDYNTPDLTGECTTLTVTKQVTDITSTSTPAYQQYPDTQDIIEAYVTSSDEGGNFYKSISLVSTDGAVGFSMPIDAYNLYTKFEPGRKVYVNMANRYFVTENNSTVIGSLYNNNTPEILTDDEVGRISGVEYQNIVKRSCEKVDEETLVNHLSITQAKNNANLNKLIELDEVQFTDASVGKTYFDPSINNLGGATNHLVTDKDGNTIIVRISEFALFSAKTVPSESGKIRGVLTKFGSDFQFMVRTENDIQLTEPRIVPLFEESFSTNFPNWTKYSVTGAQVWTLDTSFGNPGSCARISGFANNTNNVNEDWLISPSIDLTNAPLAKLTFDNASRFSGNLIEVYVSTNYDGSSAPNTATWTLISGATLDTNTGSYIWTNSGALNISSFIGNSNVRVAFKYTSTSSASRTWEIDNVKVTDY